MSDQINTPPRLFLRFFRWFCHPELKKYIEGDLMELYEERSKQSGKRKADIKFIIDVLLLFRPGIIRPAEGNRNLNHYGMFKNYFKISWRNIVRKKTYTAINVLGLALGVCACVTIYVIISLELSFDAFHPDKERIYRVMGDVTESTGEKLHFCKLPVPVSQNARAELSGLDVIAGIIRYNAKITIPDGDKPAKHFESRIEGTPYLTTVIAEHQYFDIFKYDWLAGNATTALRSPFTVVLTERRARMYFAAEPLDEIIGKQIIYEDSLIVSVSGIVKDWHKNSDLAFTDFISFSTIQNSFLENSINPDSWEQGDMSMWAFAKLSYGTAPAQLSAQMAELAKRHAAGKIKIDLWLQPLSDIHFRSDIVENPIRTAHMPTLYGLMGIALFILILAIINFINLSTAQSIQRAKEVGVRKVLGSTRTNLVFQFLTETSVITFFAVSLAVSLVTPVLHAFRSFIPEGVSFQVFEPSIIIFLVLITLFTSVLAGLYPAKVLSSYLPALNLKGTGTLISGEKWMLRKGLIVFQFSVSLIFIIGSMVIASQLNYAREKNLGFTADAIVTLETPRGEGRDKVAALAQKIKQISGVDKVALQWLSPMTENGRGMRLKFNRMDEQEIGVAQVAGNEDFIPLYQIKLLAGRNLEQADSVKELVINETLSRIIGNNKPEEAIGKIMYWNDKPYPVVGVVADFHSSSLHNPIIPLCIINRPEREGALAIKLISKGKQSGMIKATISQIEKVWKQIYPDKTFDYRFYDESLALLYQKDRQTATLMNTSMAIAIFISLIGLFGLTLFTTEKRAKEISIRKILGASIANITAMLSKDFIILVVIAIFIASPIAWYFMSQWLQGFAYRVDISWWIFTLAGLSVVMITLITVCFQAVKAALMNPVRNLKNE